MKSFYFFKTSREAFFTFRFAPCAPCFALRCTQMCATSLFVGRFRCCFFERVALLHPSLPLCFEPYLFPPSMCFSQRAAAFACQILIFDRHAQFSMFLLSSCAIYALKSCPYVLPRFSNFYFHVFR